MPRKAINSPSTSDSRPPHDREIERVRRRLAAVQEIGRALGSTLNLDRLLTLIMSKVTDLMNAERSTLYLLDEDSGELWSKIAQGMGKKATTIRIPVGTGLSGWVAQHGRTLNIKDAHRDPRFDEATDRETGFRTRSVLCQPLRDSRGRTIGVIQVLNRKEGYFTVEDEELLAALGAQAAISLQNSELYRTVQRRNIELVEAQRSLEAQLADRETLLEIEEAVGANHLLEPILEAVLDGAMRAIPSEAGSILLKEARTGSLVFRTARGASVEALRSRTLEPGEGIVGWVAQNGESVVSNSVVTDPRHAREVADSLEIHVETMLCVPIFVDSEVIGAIQLLNRRGRIPRYETSDLPLLKLIAGQVARAVQAQSARDAWMKENRLATIGQSISAVLHDFRTPMTIIKGYTQLLAREESAEERNEYTGSILTQITHLDTMMREVLAFARGERRLFLQKIHLHGFFDEVTETLGSEFSQRAVNLELHLDYRNEIAIDVDKMRRVLFNLAHNAADAMPEGGIFRIHVSREDDTVILTFSDTGNGIPESIQADLFDPFVTSGKKDGTGLGLAIAQQIVEQHEGTIGFETIAGEGTTFTIRLPVAGPSITEEDAGTHP